VHQADRVQHVTADAIEDQQLVEGALNRNGPKIPQTWIPEMPESAKVWVLSDDDQSLFDSAFETPGNVCASLIPIPRELPVDVSGEERISSEDCGHPRRFWRTISSHSLRKSSVENGV
jgi:hypothetical protein